MKKSRYTRYFKYPLDCLIAAFLILLTSPVLLSTILLLAIANRGSGIFPSGTSGKERKNIQDHQV